MPSDPILHTLLNLMAKPLCLHAARLTSANRQALEELIPKFLQILLSTRARDGFGAWRPARGSFLTQKKNKGRTAKKYASSSSALLASVKKLNGGAGKEMAGMAMAEIGKKAKVAALQCSGNLFANNY